MTTALIGSHGVIGQSFLAQQPVDLEFNSNNIHTLPDYDIDLLIIAAPSGNRRLINSGTEQHEIDQANVNQIIQTVFRARPRATVLFSSVDCVVAPNSNYGQNRYWLERAVTRYAQAAIYRLPTLIGPLIRKNILYDIRHNQFLDQIDAGAQLQWCCLKDLSRLVAQAQPGQTQNIVSEPVLNADILTRFCPGLVQNFWDNSAVYNQQPYHYSRDEIFAEMEQYLK